MVEHPTRVVEQAPENGCDLPAGNAVHRGKYVDRLRDNFDAGTVTGFVVEVGSRLWGQDWVIIEKIAEDHVGIDVADVPIRDGQLEPPPSDRCGCTRTLRDHAPSSFARLVASAYRARAPAAPVPLPASLPSR